MATTIKLKNSVTTTNAPSSLVQGEVAINITDKKVWVGNAATTPIQLLGDGGSVNFTTVDTTNLQVTNIKAKDGTASATIANSTGVFTHSTVTVFPAGTVSAPAITTTGDTNTGIFFPAADTIAFTEGGAEAMRIDSSGVLRVGSTSGSGAAGAITSTISSGSNLYCEKSTGGSIAFTQSGVATSAIEDISSQGGLRFYTGTSGSISERMRIDSSGNVGIGTSSPLAGVRLDTFGGYFRLRSNTTINADISGNVNALVFESSGGTGEHAIIAGGNTSNNFLSFYTANATTPAERMRITSGGDLLVGKTSANTASGTGVEIRPTGTVAVVAPSTLGDTYDYYNSTAGAYRFYVTNAGVINATSTTITAISDARLKENIQDIDVGLSELMALKPRKFDWKAGKGKDIKGDRGWIAQEFEQVFPEMISTWKDPAPEGEEPYKAVNADLIPVLVKAIQEQQAMIEELKAEVALLKSK